ncbi:hypothetical protein JHK87_050562 [Glycine soja]|nr:hypothetical protein JHK87_050562 [Glycine soja]
MLCTLGRARKWDLVESLWTEMNAKGVALVNSTYGTLIDAYSKRGLKEEALAWLQTMQSQGMEPDEVTMGIVVLLYKRAGEFQKAQEFFRRWIRGAPFRLGVDDKLVSHTNVCLSSHTYATFIDTYGKGGQFRAACETFARIIRQGRSLNTVTLNTMIHLYGNCGRRVSDERGLLKADIVSYRTLLYAYSTRKMVREAEELIQEMDERDLETQSALTRMYVELGMHEQSWLWFRTFHLAGNISSDCYSANIDAYGERGYTLAVEKKLVLYATFFGVWRRYGLTVENSNLAHRIVEPGSWSDEVDLVQFNGRRGRATMSKSRGSMLNVKERTKQKGEQTCTRVQRKEQAESSNVLPLGKNTLNITIIAQMGEEYNMTGDELMSKLMQDLFKLYEVPL